MKTKRCTAGLSAGLVSIVTVLLSVGLHGRPALPASAAQIRIELQPVVTGGLSQPVFVTNTHDGSQRLFIVEQPGRVKVLQPGSSAPTVFLDISAKVFAGGEQGLLGLAFHPNYPADRRFFVDYTRKPDGATVVSAYQVSAADPSVADPGETILLTISQPFSNHNGGMVCFGPDGYLYVGMGDGGSGNDPGNRAQNPQELLGKILRIDVDGSDGGQPYAIPPSNPYFRSSAGRGEIYALGLRNPWRFSFDRETGRLYAGDVGQDQVEEVDIVALGGNYGWRVLEGTRCTGLGPASCTAPGFLPPIAEYVHTPQRCSITGGYVYRGRQNSLPGGAYVYGDYCSGEIFMLRNGEQTALADTGLNISSFGEDENGELYVVGIGGTVDRIVNPDAPALPTFYFPRLVGTAGHAAGQDEYTGFAAVNLDLQPASLTFRAFDQGGALIQGTGIVNPRTLQLAAGEQLALLDTQVFGAGFHSQDRTAWVRLESSTWRLASFFLAFDSRISFLDGSGGSPLLLTDFLLPDVEASGFTQVFVANPNPGPTRVNLALVSAEGSTRAATSQTLDAGRLLAETVSDLFPGLAPARTDYLRGTSDLGITALEFLGATGRDVRALNAQDATSGATVLYCPQYAVGGGYRSAVAVTNLENTAGTVTLRLFNGDGTPAGSTRELLLPAKAKILIDDPTFFGSFGPQLTQGYVEIRSSGPLLSGSVTFGDEQGQTFSAALPLIGLLQSRVAFSQVASDATYYTGVAIVNPTPGVADAQIEVFDGSGRMLESGIFPVPARGRLSRLVTEYFPALTGQSIGAGYIKVTTSVPAASYALFGTNDRSTLAAIPALMAPGN